ncbi:hypothetical protein BH10ACT2_BH10ACT2_23720 [soil metagenome]
MNPESCARFEEHVEALAINELGEPESSRLLAHADSCPSCQTHLDAVCGLVDSLLQLTPRVEPPPGFESRVLEQLQIGGRAPSARWRSFTVVAACIAALLGGIILGNTVLGGANDSASAGTVARSGTIADPNGSSLGSAKLVSGSRPFVLITIDNPKNSSSDVWCELLLANGQSVTVGSWGYGDVARKVWAVGIDPALLAAVEMRIVATDGTVLATAVLH